MLGGFWRYFNRQHVTGEMWSMSAARGEGLDGHSSWVKDGISIHRSFVSTVTSSHKGAEES